jgi:hypothetical protein
MSPVCDLDDTTYATRLGNDVIERTAESQRAKGHERLAVLLRGLPEPERRALALQMPGSPWTEQSAVGKFLALLPEVAKLDARDFCMSEQYSRALFASLNARGCTSPPRRPVGVRPRQAPRPRRRATAPGTQRAVLVRQRQEVQALLRRELTALDDKLPLNRP